MSLRKKFLVFVAICCGMTCFESIDLIEAEEQQITNILAKKYKNLSEVEIPKVKSD